jgi:hypothetical protein
MTKTTQTSFTKLPPLENGDEGDGKAEQDQEAAVSLLYFDNLNSNIVFETR